MTFLDLVNARQSVRTYEPGRRIPREILERCLEAARLAPSACNSQPWSFVVVDDPEQVRALAGKPADRPTA
jgi:nitroreductase